MTALYIIPILAVLILIHELGHFVTARLAGIRVEEFGIGLPPRLFGFRRGDVLYSVNALPIGGFVRVLGEDGKSLAPDSLQSKSKARRALFFGAGSLMNLLLAMVLITILVGARGDAIAHVYIEQVTPGSPAAQAGWQPGDRFVAVDGRPVSSMDQMVALIGANAGQATSVTLERGGRQVQTQVVPRVSPPPGEGRTGITVLERDAARISVGAVADGSAAARAGFKPGDVISQVAGTNIGDVGALALALANHAGQSVPVTILRDGQTLALQLTIPQTSTPQETPTIGLGISQHLLRQPVPWWKVLPRGIADTFGTLHQMVSAVLSLFQNHAAVGGIAGPIGMGQLTSEMLKVSPEPAWVTLANIMALLSLNLALLNLIPFPALDGGRLFFVLVEAIRGRRVPPEKEGVVHFVGLVVLLTFMIVVAYFDIDRIVSGQQFIR